MSKTKAKNYTDDFVALTGDILNNDKVKSMTQYNHHGIVDTHFHSVHVAYEVYKMCLLMHLSDKDTSDITRASLLHDLYLYNWYTDKHDEMHAFYHPKEAVKNIEKYNVISLSKMQKDMILRHMFPLGKIPKSKGGWILTFCDKTCAANELITKFKGFSDIYGDINDRIKSDF